MNFKGNDKERQPVLCYKRLGINYNRLTETEFRQFIHILEKSSLLKPRFQSQKTEIKNAVAGDLAVPATATLLLIIFKSL